MSEEQAAASEAPACVQTKQSQAPRALRGDDEAMRRVARQLHESETRFRVIFESAGDGILIVDAQGRIAMMNRQTEAMSGYRREELLGQHIDVLVSVRFRPARAARLAARVGLAGAARRCTETGALSGR